MSLVFTRSFGSATRKLVAVRLADHADDNGRGIWPSAPTIARECDLAKRSVQRVLDEFVAEGILICRRKGSGRNTSRYDMDLSVVDKLPRPTTTSSRSKDEGCQRVTAQSDDSGVTESHPRGDTESPLGCQRVTQTVKEPLQEPEREGAGARDGADEPEAPAQDVEGGEPDASDDPAKFETRVKRLGADWPGWAGSSTQWTVKEFAKLTDGDRADAEQAAPAYLAWCKAEKVRPVALSVYFRDRKWREIPDGYSSASEKPTQPDDYGPAFGPVWGAARMAGLLDGRDAHVRALDRNARFGRGWRFHERYHALKLVMEPVPVGSPTWDAWHGEFYDRNWPMPPRPEKLEVVYFPKGGPAMLSVFEAAMRKGADDGQA